MLGSGTVKPPEVFKTDRLVLRKPRMSDAEAIFKGYAQDRNVSKYLTWRPHQRIEESRTFLETLLDKWESGSGFEWVITERGKNRCIGMTGFRLRESKAEVGYVLARDFWGQGIMTEAVRAIVDWLSVQSTIFRVWAVCDIENVASARVLEKTGMVKEGILHKWASHPNISSEPRDCICYSKVNKGQASQELHRSLKRPPAADKFREYNSNALQRHFEKTKILV